MLEILIVALTIFILCYGFDTMFGTRTRSRGLRRDE